MSNGRLPLSTRCRFHGGLEDKIFVSLKKYVAGEFTVAG